MPPKKKDKKMKKERKPRKKKVIKLMTQPSLPKLPTGFNRDLPFGAGGGGSGNLIAAIASRPPTQPIQTPDQFSVIQDSRKAADLLKEVVTEQVRVRKERSDKGKKRKPAEQPTGPPPTLAALAAGGATVSQPQVQEVVQPTVSGSIRKVGNKKLVIEAGDVENLDRQFGTPPTGHIKGESGLVMRPTMEGGGEPEQGLNMGTTSKLRGGSRPDGSTSLVGVTGIGDYDGVTG